MNPVDTARAGLVDAAIALAAGDINDAANLKSLCVAADTFARALWASKTGSQGRRDKKPTTSTLVLRFTKSKGKTLADAPTSDLRFALKVCTESLDDASKQQYRRQNAEMVAALEAELQFRGEG